MVTDFQNWKHLFFNTEFHNLKISYPGTSTTLGLHYSVWKLFWNKARNVSMKMWNVLLSPDFFNYSFVVYLRQSFFWEVFFFFLLTFVLPASCFSDSFHLYGEEVIIFGCWQRLLFFLAVRFWGLVNLKGFESPLLDLVLDYAHRHGAMAHNARCRRFRSEQRCSCSPICPPHYWRQGFFLMIHSGQRLFFQCVWLCCQFTVHQLLQLVMAYVQDGLQIP